MLSLSIDAQALLDLALEGDHWSLVEGRNTWIELSMDGKVVLPRTEIAADADTRLVLGLDERYSLLYSFRDGGTLELGSSDIQINGVRFAIEDGAAALHRMAQCFPREIARPRDTAGPMNVKKQAPLDPDTRRSELRDVIAVMEGVDLNYRDPEPPPRGTDRLEQNSSRSHPQGLRR